MMDIVLFFEKPGCTTNAAQKKVLRDSDCMVIERNLLDNGLSCEELHAFFSDRPVHEWFNPNAPMVKSGSIDPASMDASTALNLLLTEPILIRRPLIVLKNRKLCGFDEGMIASLLGRPLKRSAGEACSGHQGSCAEQDMHS
jgi:nitrogenase-associated protein